MGSNEIRINELNINQVKDLISLGTEEELKILLELVKLDPRKGVRNLQRAILRKFQEAQHSLEKQKTLLKEENRLWDMGYKKIGGIDEAGRGPLAGPVVAACVVFRRDIYIEGIDDSKKLSPIKRDKLYETIMDRAEAIGIGRVAPEEIDRINILRATRRAMEQAAKQCYPDTDFLLVDAMEAQFPVPYTSLIKGDAHSHSIAAASIIAKVTRDREMEKWHSRYPQYGFNLHKGYGTAKHIEAIKENGLCPIHRRSFTGGLI